MKSNFFILIGIAVTLLIGGGCRDGNRNDSTDNVCYLSNGSTTIGVLPGVGGRLVYLASDGSGNLLKSDSMLWNEPDSLRPEVSTNAGWKAYNGQIIWLGPQSEWWVHQEIDAEKSAKRANWPPDPWLIYAEYAILGQTDTSIMLQGPSSPVSGVTLTKEFAVSADGSILCAVTCRNTREIPVAWDLWINTRVDGNEKVYVPVDHMEQVRIKSTSSAYSDTVPYVFENGYFSYLPVPPPPGKRNNNSKAFITPSKPFMVAEIDSFLLWFRFDLYPPALTHPEQAMVEIYNATFPERSEALTEIEYHAPYQKLNPGETMESKIIIQVQRASGNIGAWTTSSAPQPW